jgi:hypothetical protein
MISGWLEGESNKKKEILVIREVRESFWIILFEELILRFQWIVGCTEKIAVSEQFQAVKF